MCSIDKSIDKVSRYFWYRDISKYRQYRPSLKVTPCETWSTVYLRPQIAVSSIRYSAVTLNFDLLTQNYRSFHLCPTVPS